MKSADATTKKPVKANAKAKAQLNKYIEVHGEERVVEMIRGYIRQLNRWRTYGADYRKRSRKGSKK